ncbi:MAG: hypothetical protein L6R41_007230 [Letrouitia leprolyta]|nr:MAG: hypothetical protein L6R41_007230 [Letrouitia leprolyta]
MLPHPPFQAISALLSFLFISSAHAVDHVAWTPGTLQVTAPNNVCSVDFGATVHLNSDGNLVFFRTPDPETIEWSSDKISPNCVNGACTLYFQTDGNLVVYGPGNVPLWWSDTAGRGALLVCNEDYPHFEIFDKNGRLIWYPSFSPQYSYYFFPRVYTLDFCLDGPGGKRDQPWLCIG